MFNNSTGGGGGRGGGHNIYFEGIIYILTSIGLLHPCMQAVIALRYSLFSSLHCIPMNLRYKCSLHVLHRATHSSMNEFQWLTVHCVQGQSVIAYSIPRLTILYFWEIRSMWPRGQVGVRASYTAALQRRRSRVIVERGFTIEQVALTLFTDLWRSEWHTPIIVESS